MSNDDEGGTMIPIGRIEALLTAYDHEIETLGEATPEARVYRRVCRDLRAAIEPELGESRGG